MAWAALALCFLFQTLDFNALGMKALEDQKYEEAAGHFQKAAEADPEDYGAHFHLGLSYSLLDRDDEAIPAYRKVLELKPGLYEAELNLGILYLRRKEHAQAAPLLEGARKTKPGEYRPAFYLAEALFGADRIAEAEEHYRGASAIDPKSAPAVVGLARCLVRLDRFDEAVEQYRRAASMDPEFADAIFELAAQYEVDRQPRKAIEIYERYPDNAAARERLGELLVQVGEFAAAIPHLEFAVKQSPTSANRLALAHSYFKTNQADKALPLVQQIVKDEPENFEMRMLYGRALRDKREFRAAAQEFLIAVRARPDSAEAWNELSGMLIMLEAYPQALQALDRAKAAGGEAPGHYFFRGMIFDKMRQYPEALAGYQKFLEMSGGKNPDEEFKARQRIKVIQKELNKR